MKTKKITIQLDDAAVKELATILKTNLIQVSFSPLLHRRKLKEEAFLYLRSAISNALDNLDENQSFEIDETVIEHINKEKASMYYSVLQDLAYLLTISAAAKLENHENPGKKATN